LYGVSYKHLWYDDNTAVTRQPGGKNEPEVSHTAGLFAQDEIAMDSAEIHKILLGARVDYNNVYRWVPSPRIAYKWTPSYRFTSRVNLGTGFRIVNVFTEDHAALTGARQVVFEEKITPEQSYNGSLNVVHKQRIGVGSALTSDATLFYYHFTNKIVGDYDTDPAKVIYRNLHGYAFSRGASLNVSLVTPGPFKMTAGVTYNEVRNVRRDSAGAEMQSVQMNAPAWSGNVLVAYEFKGGLKTDVTANWYGPQRLPVLPNDFRPEYSPAFCLLNLQVTKIFSKSAELFAGAKNILNFIPEYPIMRPFDPFDKKVDSADNPNGYTFDTGYNYAPVQGVRFYLGFRYTLKD
jgi:outer membrane receptor for ferrienterochelin and colicins